MDACLCKHEPKWERCDPWHRDEHCGTLGRSSVFVEG